MYAIKAMIGDDIGSDATDSRRKTEKELRCAYYIAKTRQAEAITRLVQLTRAIIIGTVTGLAIMAALSLMATFLL